MKRSPSKLNVLCKAVMVMSCIHLKNVCTFELASSEKTKTLNPLFPFVGDLHTHTCSAKVGEWMQVKLLRLSCSKRSLMLPSTTSTLFSCRSFTGSRVARPPGLASASRSSSCVAVEMAWPGGSCLRKNGKILYCCYVRFCSWD